MDKNSARELKLLQLLKQRERMDIASVVDEFGISEATARRMFASLENAGKLIRIHGGIQMAPQLARDYSYRLSAAERVKEKQAIGSCAADFIESGDRIFMDSGTTVLRLAEALAMRIKLGKIDNLSIVTNSLSFAGSLGECNEVVLVGGNIRSERMDVCGIVAERNLEKYHFDKIFLGTDAIGYDGTLMTTDDATARMNEILIKNTEKCFILADSGKFSRKAFIRYGKLDAALTLITDSAAKKSDLAGLRKTAARIIIA